MKFCKKYKEYVQGQKQELPWVGFKNLKMILSQCREECECHKEVDDSSSDPHSCSLHCPVCDGTFFPSLLEEMSAVVGCFNKRAQKLLQLHLASGFKKYLLWLKGERDHTSLIQEGKDLVTYAIINSVAVRKILKKYDKVHYSTQGQAFRSKAQSIHIEILQSPWLCELMAFHINIRKQHINPKSTPSPLFEGSSLVFDDENKPSLSCELFDSVKFDIDLTCSICLDTVFDPVSLKCGHIFCYMCACSAASVTIVDGLEAATPRERCPLCREAGVFEGAVRLDELSILLSRSCPEYWEKRLQAERKERIQQAKQHWETQCQAFLGV